jgi:GST-like protein
MTITLYAWGTPNGRKVSVALEEMELPYTVVPINIGKREQFQPEFLRISPNNKIPAIVDPNGPAAAGNSDGSGGQPISVFESGAILLYLGEKTGKFLPASLRDRVPVLEWLMWQMGGFGPMPGQVHHFAALEAEADRRYGLKRFSDETHRLYGVLDRRLADVEFVAGELSVADFAILGWAWRHERHKVDLATYPNVRRWYETLFARPGVQRGFAVEFD